MRPGWNATRRSRNIGTAKQGHGTSNRLVIPERWHHDGKAFFERLGAHTEVRRQVLGKAFTFIVEQTRRGFVQACTVDDLALMLWMIPPRDLEGLSRIVLKQSTRKEDVLDPCWGRIVYSADFLGELQPTILLYSVPCHWTWKKRRSLPLEDQRELDRLRDDGHRITADRRRYLIESDLESARATQLYRTLPHEAGHWLDYLESVVRPGRGPESSRTQLEERQASRPTAEKEVFAHRYADELVSDLVSRHKVPFPRQLDLELLEQEGLRVEDFVGAD